MHINSQKLIEEIQKDLLDLKQNEFIENSAFAIHEDEDLQIQVCITKDKDEHVAKIVPDILTTKQAQNTQYQIIMPRELTAENGAKALFMGEFSIETQNECIECDGLGHEDTEEMLECEICEGRGIYLQKTPVDWSTIKEIYALAVKHLAQ